MTSFVFPLWAGVDSKKEKGTGKKSKASLGQEDGSDDEYQGGSQVGAASQGQSNREWNALSSDDKKMSVNKIVNFMLARDADKVGAPCP